MSFGKIPTILNLSLGDSRDIIFKRVIYNGSNKKMSKREIEYIKKLNKALESENQLLQERLKVSETVVETLFSHAKEIQ